MFFEDRNSLINFRVGYFSNTGISRIGKGIKRKFLSSLMGFKT